MSQSLVSVVIPTYQRAATLRRALDHALGQSYKPLEVVVSDNGSTDGSRELLIEYAQDPRVTVVLQDENRGPVPNWRTAVEASQGKYIKINWSDDWMEDHVVEDLVMAMDQAPDIEFATMNQHIHSADGVKEQRRWHGPVTLADLGGSMLLGLGLPVSPGAGLVLREDVEWALGPGTGRLNRDCTERAIGPDLLMLYGALRRGGRGMHLDREGVHFQGGSDSISIQEKSEVLAGCYHAALHVLVEESDDTTSLAALLALISLQRFSSRLRGRPQSKPVTIAVNRGAWFPGGAAAARQIARRLTRNTDS